MASYKINTQVPSDIFRAYDIRGIVGDSFTPDNVYTIGRALGSAAKEQGETTMAVARDGRLSGPELSQALIAGILDCGIDVIDIGAVPTPLLYFATHTLATRSGVMLTGSHNPPDYNGIKAVIKSKTLSEDSIYSLYHRIEAKNFTEGSGKISHAEIILPYIQRITQDIKLKRKLKIVIDSGNGIPGAVAPQLFKALGCEVIELFCDVDGRFPNHHPDPLIPENLTDLIHAVKQHHADIGLAFDGDGDRLGVVTDQGEIIWPDRQMLLYAIEILKHYPGAPIVFDVKCTSHLGPTIAKHGGKPIMWRTGHSVLKAKLQETKGPLAGEMSGHIFFNDRWYGFDDGLYTGVRLLEIIANDQRSCSEIFAALPNSVNTPELKLAIADDRKFKFMEEFKTKAKFSEGTVNTIDGVRVDFPYGFGLVRPSNTTPYLTLRFEADNAENLQRVQNIFREQLLALDKSLVLPF
jgi:phosphomannomutase/phosphoglucomutase